MRWVLITGDRLAVSAALLVGIFVVFVALTALNVVQMLQSQRMMWFLNGAINGLLTLIPITIGINQIILSRELDSIDSFYDRLTDTVAFRNRVEDNTGVAVSPSMPADFCRVLFLSLHDRALAFRRDYEAGGGSVDDAVDEYVRTVSAEADRIAAELDTVGYDVTKVFLTLLNYEDSDDFHTTRRLRHAPDAAVPEPARERLDEITELFQNIDATKQYLKTLFIQRELSRLTRMLLYTGIPSVLVAAIGIFGYRDVPQQTLVQPFGGVAVSALVAVVLLPLAVLAAYLLRVATIAQRSAAFGPFIPETEYRRLRDRSEE